MIRLRAEHKIKVDEPRVQTILDELRQDPMAGWLMLPETYDRAELKSIQAAAQKIQQNSEYLVCIGIGGSYLGHRAIIEALRPTSSTKVLYAGNSLSPFELQKVFDELGNADFSVNVISKSGTTTEPAVAFRFFKEKLIQKYGVKAAERIYATTDENRGALHDEAVQEGYARFVVPDNIGGRYSVLSAVGLLPLAVAGVDVEALLAGAAIEYNYLNTLPLAQNSAIEYATARADLLQRSYDVEVLACFEPRLHYFAEWWKQLFGESEGKQHQGIFPASTVYTTDLHSLGQYLQEGRRNIFETVLSFDPDPETDFIIPESAQNLDGLNYLARKKLSYLNQTAEAATISAHRAGGIPVYQLMTDKIDAQTMGALIYFFELACAISAKLSGVNPFNQPGVEAYKNNMFHLLGKPGF